MDPWDPRKQEGPYTARRISRVTIPNPEYVDVEGFRKNLDRAKTLGKKASHDLFFQRKRIKDLAGFILARAKGRLPKNKGERLAMASVILHQALTEFEAVSTAAEEIRWVDWIDRRELRERTRLARGIIQTTVQNLLMRTWAALPRELRTPLFQAGDDSWRRICRGSISAAFVARGFQGIAVSARPKKKSSKCTHFEHAPCHQGINDLASLTCDNCTKSCGEPRSSFEDKENLCPPTKQRTRKKRRHVKQWQVYSPTDQEDRWGKIDLIAVGRLAGLGEIGLCIQIKTGDVPYLEVITQDPSETRGDHEGWEEIRDRLWDSMDEFLARHPEIRKAKKKFFPAIIQTGGAVAGVTQVAKNTKAVRELIQKMLEDLAKELRAQRKRKRELKEFDEPGFPRRQKR